MKHSLTAVLALFLAVAPNLVFPQAAEFQSQVFEGFLEDGRPVRLMLNFDGQLVDGTLSDKKAQTVHVVSGSNTANGKLELLEMDNAGKTVRQFEGKLYAGYLFKGTWSQGAGAAGKPFLLNRVEDTKTKSAEGFVDAHAQLKEADGPAAMGPKTEPPKAALYNDGNTPFAKGDVSALVEVFKNCKTDCNQYTSKAACTYFGISDFTDPLIKDAFLSAGEIHSYVSQSPNWRLIGPATSSVALAETLSHVEGGIPALAMKDGLTAILVAGETSVSSGWGGVEVPNATVFFSHRPEMSFTGRPLSYVWSKAEGVELWVRKP